MPPTAFDIVCYMSVSVIMLYRRDGKMLLEHRTEGRKNFPGCWAFFGGHFEEGEGPKEALYREAKEELSYTLSDPKFVYTQRLENGSEKHVFVEAYDESQPIVLLPYESQGYGWFTLEEAKSLPKLIPHDIEPLDKVWDFIVANDPSIAALGRVV